MTTVLKKGAPSRSFPSRQRKLGPAPFASFEDLSDDMESPLVEVMPPHVEEEAHSSSHQPVTATSSSTGYSQPTSGLQTPSTPRIDISCASSSSPPSEDSDKELFQGGLGFAFQEEGTEELRSSTEELDLGQVADDLDSEEEKRQKREDKEELRRGSHPTNIFSSRRKSSNNNYGGGESSGDDLSRKPSAHTLFLDNLLSRHTRHASFGAGDNNYTRPGALSSMSAHSSGSTRGRSPSPHKMMLETSFCGSKPIPTKSMDIPDNDPPPILQEVPPKSERSLSIKSIPHPHSTSPSPTHTNSRRPSSCGRRSVSPFKMMLETSFCGSKPIPTKSMEVQDDDDECSSLPPHSLEDTPTQVTTAQVHYSSFTGGGGGEPCSPKSSDHWRPVTPKSGDVVDGAISPSESSPSQSTAKYVTTPNPAANLKLHTTNIFKWPDTEPEQSSSKVQVEDDLRLEEGGGGGGGVVIEEAKFLHQSESYEDFEGDLPYVPTTLPQEKPSLPPIPNSSQRFNPTHIPLQRPKANRPQAPADINDYIAYSEKATEGQTKMKISLPREDSFGGGSSTGGGGERGEDSPKRTVGRTGSIGATNWADFAEMGLRSPRDLRRKLREENGGEGD